MNTSTLRVILIMIRQNDAPKFLLCLCPSCQIFLHFTAKQLGILQVCWSQNKSVPTDIFVPIWWMLDQICRSVWENKKKVFCVLSKHKVLAEHFGWNLPDLICWTDLVPVEKALCDKANCHWLTWLCQVGCYTEPSGKSLLEVLWKRAGIWKNKLGMWLDEQPVCHREASSNQINKPHDIQSNFSIEKSLQCSSSFNENNLHLWYSGAANTLTSLAASIIDTHLNQTSCCSRK